MILPPLIFRVWKDWGGNTFAGSQEVFFESSIFSFFSWCFFFRVMTSRSCESWTNPLDRREELRVTVFFCCNRIRLKKRCRMCHSEDISRNCNGLHSTVGGKAPGNLYITTRSASQLHKQYMYMIIYLQYVNMIFFQTHIIILYFQLKLLCITSVVHRLN